MKEKVKTIESVLIAKSRECVVLHEFYANVCW